MSAPRAAWALAFAGALALGLASCAGRGSPKPSPAPPPAIRGEDARLDVFAGQGVVIPLDAAAPLRGAGTASLADGTLLRARRVRIIASVSPEESALGWLAPAGQWRAVADEGQPEGVPALFVDLPAGAAGDLVLEGRARRTNWLAPATSDDVAWEPVRPEAAAAGLTASRWVGPEARSPLTRWRWRLVADGLRPDAAVAPFADPVIEALAAQTEGRWRVALSRLHASDAALARRLRARLAGIVDFGDGVYAPCWAGREASLDLLLADLLDPRADAAARARAADDWLRESPPAVAWVIDDGGTIDATRAHTLPSLGVVSLLDREITAFASRLGSPSPDLTPLPPLTAVTLLVPPTADAPKADLVEAHVGDWSVTLPALTGLSPVTPPGYAIATFAADWSMESWTTGIPRGVRGEWSTSSLLHRPARPPGAPATSERSRLWELLVECRVREGEPFDAEQVLVYAGPFGRSAAALRVRPSGAVERLPLAWQAPGVETLAGGAGGAIITRRPSGWTLRVPLPPGAVDKDGLLRLGLVRVDARGVRSAWPRPMLPWQDEPGRAALDTRAWGVVTDSPAE